MENKHKMQKGDKSLPTTEEQTSATPGSQQAYRPGPACSKGSSTNSTPTRGRSRSPIVRRSQSSEGASKPRKKRSSASLRSGSSSSDEDAQPRKSRSRRSSIVLSGSETEVESRLSGQGSRATSSEGRGDLPPGMTLEQLQEAEKGHRERSPTISKYQEKQMLLEIRRKELDLRIEEEVVARITNAIQAFPRRGEGTISDVPTCDLAASVDEAISTVEEVAKKSKNLKGGYVKTLKSAAQVVKASMDEMTLRVQKAMAAGAEGGEDPSSTELARVLKKLEALEAENGRLRGEIEALKRAPPPPSPLNAAPLTSMVTTRGRRLRGSTREVPPVEGFPPLPPPPSLRTAPPPPEAVEVEMEPDSAPQTPEAPRREDLLVQIGLLMDQKLSSLRKEMVSLVESRTQHASSQGNLQMGRQGGNTAKTVPNKTLPADGLESIGGGNRGRAKAAPTPTPAPSKPSRTKAPRAQSIGSGGGGENLLSQASVPAPSSAGTAKPSPSDVSSWTEVVKRGKGKKKAAPQAQMGKTTPPPIPRPSSVRGGRAEKAAKGRGGNKPTSIPPKKKRKAPKSAAVTINCPEGASAAVLTEAREKVDLTSVGIPQGVRVRRTQTGATSWEVSGEGRVEKADALASQLRRIFADRTDIVVSRPVKTAELRIANLDDSATSEDVVEAVASAGGCARDAVKAGSLKQGPNRLNACWVRCPMETANRLARAGSLKVGWVKARVALLEARRLQCFRCLELGHVRVNCTNGVDRSAWCYRCGDPGHSAQTCNKDAKCPVCAEAGRPSGHRVGSKACPPPKKPGKKKKGGEASSAPGPRTEVLVVAAPPNRKGDAQPPMANPLPVEEGTMPPPRVREEIEPGTSMEVEERTSRSRADKRRREKDGEEDSSPPLRIRGRDASEELGDSTN